MADIKPEDVDELEKYTNEHHRELIDSLTCCNAENYKKQIRFHFLPGHRKFILRLPEEIEKMKKDSNVKRPYKPRIKKTKIIARNKQPSEQLSKQQLPQAENTLYEDEFVDIMSEENVLPDKELHNLDVYDTDSTGIADDISTDKTSMAENLQHELVTKLNQALNNKKRQCSKKIEANSVCETELSFDINGHLTVGKSRVICPFCGIKCLVLYNSYWRTSNMLKHLAVHKAIPAEQQEEPNENSPSKNIESDLSGLSESNEDEDIQKTLSLSIESCESSLEEVVKMRVRQRPPLKNKRLNF